MAKSTSRYFCKECGYESAKWLGQCPSCRAWNTFVEEPVVKASPASGFSRNTGTRPPRQRPVRVDEIALEKEDRIPTGFQELDRVLGGGIVVGSMVLLGGDPGIGKSTILLEVSRNLAADDGKSVLYVSGEEIQAVNMLPGYTHNIINLSETENLVTVMWANECFDPARPDTFFEVV